MARDTKTKLDNDVDALFKLPISDFIGARKTLATQLKKEGRADEADYVRTLAKPSISAWTVNQLYWEHRDAFDRLLATGQRFRRAQTSRVSGKVSDMREALDARRQALSHLSELATTLLRDAGHNPTLDTMRRITTTLEAMSVYEITSGGPTPGRLTKDVDPPGFESLASFIQGAGTAQRTEEPGRGGASNKLLIDFTKTSQKVTSPREVNRREETRQAKIATAKLSLQAARKSLADAKAKGQRLETAQKKAEAEAKEADKQRHEAEGEKREAELRLKKAIAASDDAKRRAQSVRTEVDAATKAMDDARRNVEKATKELESLFRQSPTR